MAPVMEFNISDRDIGLIVRPTRIGPESEMASCFMAETIENLRDRKRQYAVFLEPQLDSGFPDIVITSFCIDTFADWKPERSSLTVFDLKLLQHLHFVGGADSAQIEQKLGVDSKALIRSLEKLLDSNLVYWKKKTWKPIAINRVFGIKSIIAIEAKMKNWSEALRQAEMNWWFASESYVLSPITNPKMTMVEKAINLGVGLYSIQNCKNIVRPLKSKRGRLPSSYASWLFNEWIGRRLCCQ